MSRTTYDGLPPTDPAGGDALWAAVARAQDEELEDEGAAARALARVTARAGALARGARPRALRWRWLVPGVAAASLAGLWLARAPRHVSEPPGVVQEGSALRFADGSRVEVAAGARVEVERLVGGEADLRLDRGSVTSVVAHAPDKRWRLRAGPFTVRVTGTRFVTRWEPERGGLEVSLLEGSVVVEGGPLGQGVSLRAGQRLRADARSGLLAVTGRGEAAEAPTALAPEAAFGGVEPVAPASAAASVAGAPAAGRPPVVASPSRGALAARGAGARPEWVRLALRGEHRPALAAVQAHGVARLCAEAGPEELLLLADLARYGAHPEVAEEALRALLARFPRRLEASDALFALGRLAAEAGHADAAARWFERYTRQWPRGPLVAQARARLRELRAGASVRLGAPGAATAGNADGG